jgi:hypothetical protein
VEQSGLFFGKVMRVLMSIVRVVFQMMLVLSLLSLLVLGGRTFRGRGPSVHEVFLLNNTVGRRCVGVAGI